MRLSGPEYTACDVLVIGGGGAGLRAAIQAREAGAAVCLVSKSQVGVGNNTVLSKATFVGATGWGDDRDTPEVHVRDTLEAGRFINDPHLTERIAANVVEEVFFLEKCGVSFQKKGGEFVIDWVPGHRYPRHVFGKNRRGSDLTFPLRGYASKIGVRFVEKVFITRVLACGKGLCATGVDDSARFLVFRAGAVVLATGGFGQIYLNTNNAPGISGDGYALAFHVGVSLRDMEFVQFYPTSLGTWLLAYEVFVDICGAILRNSRGEDVVEKHGLKEHMAMTRDRLAQAIMREILEGRDVDGGVVMDLRPVPEVQLLRRRHFLPAEAKSGRREFVVCPTAHFSMGGIVTDEEARTSLPGLFVCGEASGGFHGANRLAGNALTEVFTMGRVAGNNAEVFARETSSGKPDPSEVNTEKRRLESLFGGVEGKLGDAVNSLKEVMWLKAGIIRSRRGLEEALERIKEIRSVAQRVRVDDVRALMRRLELDNMLLAAEMVSQAALERRESRGAHFREDYPEEDPEWRASLFVINRQGALALEKKPSIWGKP